MIDIGSKLRRVQGYFSKHVFYSKAAVISICLFYAFYFILTGILQNKTIDSVIKSLFQNLNYLGFFFSLLALLWLADTRRAIINFGNRYKYFEVVELIDDALNSDGTDIADKWEALIAKLFSVNPEDIKFHNHRQDTTEQLCYGIPPELTLNAIRNEIISIYFDNIDKSQQLTNNKHIMIRLKILKTFIRDSIVEG